jgi:hypothetical protein
VVSSWKDKRQEQCTGLLCEAAEPPSPCSVQPVAAGSHGPAAGAVSSFKLEAGWEKRSRGRRQRPGKVCPARSKPPCLLCTLPVPPPVRSPSLGCLRQALPGGFREVSRKVPGYLTDQMCCVQVPQDTYKPQQPYTAPAESVE